MKVESLDLEPLAKLTVAQSIVITGFTGYLFCSYGELLADLSRRLSRKVEPEDIDTLDIRAIYLEDFVNILPVGPKELH